jgi:hypothetical protein
MMAMQATAEREVGSIGSEHDDPEAKTKWLSIGGGGGPPRSTF